MTQALLPTCRGCGAQLRQSARFCDACGQPLDAPADLPASAPATHSLPHTLAVGRYQVQRFLGEGAKKQVYLARDSRLDRDVAIAIVKTEGLDDTGRLRVRREAQAMARLGDHPHIVTVHDISEDDGQILIVSQYMAGGSVEELLKHQRPLPLADALRIASQVCEALAYAHTRGIVHRDLKPGNVWLAADGTAKLGDFGLAAAIDRTRLTQPGMMVGTVAYMPPEQALGRPPDPRSDLYSLGAMLYEMVTGRPPFVGDDAVSVISQHINTPPVAPSWHNAAVPPVFEALMLRLLAKVPEDRPDGAASVCDALAAIIKSGETVEEAPPAAAGNPLDRLAGGIFVGRARETDELRAGLDDALSGRGRLLLLVGEPGIGKTRTADELGTYARLRNAQVLIGRCYEGEGAPAYWPWVQIVRSYAHTRDEDTLRTILGSGAADIAQVVSDIRERLPHLPAPPVLEPEQARFRLFDSVTTFLKNAAQQQPLMLIVDDLHWADKPSLLLLQFLARELAGSRILVLATYRDVELRRQHPLAQALGELAREQLSQRILLRGLTERDVAHFIGATAGVEPPAALVAAVFKETEGNPFFVSEVTRLLVSDGRLQGSEATASWNVTIPQSVREVIGRRLDRLSDECNRVLTTAAVIGREFPLTVLAAVLDAPPAASAGHERLLELLEEAVAARVIGDVPRSLARYSFSHALIRETLYAELSTTRRVRLHRQIGEVLQHLHAANLDSHLAELAYHFFEAAPGGDVGRAIDYAVRAARRGISLLAYEDAVAHYERALQAIELQEPADEEQRCGLLLDLGIAQRCTGDFTKARETFLRAARVARALPPMPGNRPAVLLARAALGFAEEGVQAGWVDQPGIDLLEEALRGIDSGDSALRAELLTRLANQLYWTDKQDRTATLSQTAVEMAQRVGDPVVLARTLASRHIVMWNPENLDELLSAANEIVRLSEAGGDRGMVSLGHEWRIVSLMQLGDIVAVDREIAAHRQLVAELRMPLQLWLSTTWLAMRALMDGRFDAAEHLANQAMTMGRRLRQEDVRQAHAVQTLFLRQAQGRLADVEETVLRFVTQYRQLPAWRCALALVHVELGRLEEARAAFEHLAANDFAALRRDLLWLIAVTLLAQVCTAFGDAQRAATLYGFLLPYAGRNVVVGGAVVCAGSASYYLGLLAATMGRWVDAVHHFDDALRMHERINARPFIAFTQYDYARMLLSRNQPGDRERALPLLNAALQTAQDLDLRRVVQRATAAKLEAQGIASADFTTSIDAVASTVQRQRPDLRRHVAADGTVTLLFSDMEGFTQMTERLGDQAAHKVIQAHNAIVRQQLAAHGGFELELQGDGFLLAFAQPILAVRCAMAIQRAFAAYSDIHHDQPIHVRIGLHAGQAITEADRFFGKTVILAARIAAQAQGEEILVSSALKDLADSEPGMCFGSGRETSLKGLMGTYVLYPVEWRA